MPQRLLALAFLAVALWYLFWRLGTFNPDALVFSATLYATECWGLASLLLHLFMTWRLSVRRALPVPHGLSVDVFVTTYNESVEVLRRTLQGALAIDYPHQTWLLDDGNRAEMRALATEIGCLYFGRKHNTNAKAGNLNNALTHSTAEFVAIFDADHVPSPQFLNRTLGYFSDPLLAFVQTPQEFYNLDSYQNRGRGHLRWGEQGLFFRVIERGKDYWNATMLVGTSAVLRRSALNEIGGFATGTVTEDLHTTLRLQKKGFRSVYHAEALAFGLAPQSLRAFLTQRLRWGQGAMQVWKQEGLIFPRGHTMAQRICNLASVLTYFDSWPRIFLYLTPGLVLISGIMPIAVFNTTFLIHFLPYYLLNFWVSEEVARGYGNTPYIEQYNLLRAFVYARATLALFRRKHIAFNVSDKGAMQRPAQDRRLLFPQILLVGYLLVCIAWGLWRQSNEPQLPFAALVANLIWAALTVLLAGGLLAFARQRLVRRQEYRFRVPVPVRLDTSAGPVFGVGDDISPGGMRLYAIFSEAAGALVQGKLYLPSAELGFQARMVSPPEPNDRHLSLQYVWPGSHAPTSLLHFLYGSDLQWRIQNLSARFRPPLELLSDALSRRHKFLLPEAKHWAALMKMNAQDRPVGLITDFGENNDALILSYAPLSATDLSELILWNKEYQQRVQGSLLPIDLGRTLMDQHLYLYRLAK